MVLYPILSVSMPPSLEYIIKHGIILTLAFLKILFLFFLKALDIIQKNTVALDK